MSVLDILFPRQCVGCGQYDTWMCSVCVTTSLQYEHTLFPPELQQSTGITSIRTCGYYAQPFWKHAIRLLKFHGIEDIAIPLGEVAAGIMHQNMAIPENSILIPMPTPAKRQRQRGYNHAERIAQVMSTRLNIPMNTQILRRSHFTHSQTTVSTHERYSNVVDSFFISPAAAEYTNTTFFLIDDVITTGATITATAQLLYTLHPQATHVVAIARAQ